MCFVKLYKFCILYLINLFSAYFSWNMASYNKIQIIGKLKSLWQKKLIVQCLTHILALQKKQGNLGSKKVNQLGLGD